MCGLLGTRAGKLMTMIVVVVESIKANHRLLAFLIVCVLHFWLKPSKSSIVKLIPKMFSAKVVLLLAVVVTSSAQKFSRDDNGVADYSQHQVVRVQPANDLQAKLLHQLEEEFEVGIFGFNIMTI